MYIKRMCPKFYYVHQSNEGKKLINFADGISKVNQIILHYCGKRTYLNCNVYVRQDLISEHAFMILGTFFIQSWKLHNMDQKTILFL